MAKELGAERRKDALICRMIGVPVSPVTNWAWFVGEYHSSAAEPRGLVNMSAGVGLAPRSGVTPRPGTTMETVPSFAAETSM
jgi:hypothetical protein